MTIPDLGHCAGSGGPPLEGSVQTAEGGETGLCRVGSGRLPLSEGALPPHESTPVEEREPLQPEVG